MKKILLLLLLPLITFGQKEVIIHITTDNYPNETKWTLYKDSYPNGDVLGSVPYGHYTQANTSHMDTLYISDTITNIAWVIFDSWGDGMPGGSYYVSICSDTIISYPVPTFTNGLIHNRVVPQCMPNPPPGVPATVIINLDQYQGETSWDIKDTNGTIYAQSVAYNGHPDYATIIIPVNIPKGPLEFTIYDTYGDGLNGALWQGQDGSYYLTQCNDTLIYGTDPAFGYDTIHSFVSDSCPPILGCMDTNYVEFNPFANVDDGSCSILKVFGCIDSTMYNYDSLANTMNMIGSCDYTLILHDLMGNGWVGSSLKLYADDTTEYHHTGGFNEIYSVNLKAPRLIDLQFFISAQASLTTIECGFTLINPEGDTAISIQPPFIQPLFVYNTITNCGNTCIEKVFGCTDVLAVNYDSLANTDDVSCYYNPGCMNSSYLEYYTQGFTADHDDGTCLTLAVWGCIDSTAFNYNSLANIDNGGCLPVITGCMQPLAFNYNAQANTPDTCIAIVYGCMSSIAINYDSLANTDDGSCIGVNYGCTDSTMWNYSPSANSDDGSCIPYIYGCMDAMMYNYCGSCNTDNNSCIPYIYGCMDSTMFNYNVLANTNNSSCISYIYGCTDSTALNYNLLANTSDNSCIPYLYGCIDSTAINYNALANTDDGSCIAILLGCTDSLALNYNSLANTNDGSCIAIVYGCMDSIMFNYNPNANTSDGSCIPFNYGCTDIAAFNYDSIANIDDSSCIPFIYGCMDVTMFNYCNSCNTDNGSCIPYIYGCVDSSMFNYDPLANTDNNTCIEFIYGCTNPLALNYNPLANTDNFSCIMPIYGCMDSLSFNYNPLANVDNGSCIPVILGCTDPVALNYCDSCNTDDFSCILPIYGCTDSIMFNFNPLANVDNNSCIPYIYGCTNPSMLNYNSEANTEDFSCIAYIYGCMDSTALNYDSTANTDNGSCLVMVEGCMDPSAFNYSGLANVNDSASCLYSANCISGPGNPYWLNNPCYTWVISVDEYCCENEWDSICVLTYNYCVDGWTGDLPLTRVKENKIIIYPNPTSGIITFSKEVNVRVYNIRGKQILNKNGISQIDLSKYNNGIYNISVIFMDEIINQIIIKQ